MSMRNGTNMKVHNTSAHDCRVSIAGAAIGRRGEA